MVDIAGLELTSEDREVLSHPMVGAVILFSRNYESPEQLLRLTAAIQAVRAPQLLVTVDQEGGRVQRFREGFSLLPPLAWLGQEYQKNQARALDHARRLGWLMAAEMRSVGVDLSFTPCVDVDYGISEIIGDRAFGSDRNAVARLAVAYAHGMHDAGMVATAKHFPGHGAVRADSHLTLPVDRRALADIRDDLLPYRRMIANGLAAVMVAHVVYPDVDEMPASLSGRWIKGELRGELSFAGTVFADDLSMRATAQFGNAAQRAALALGAGCDVLPVCNDREAVLEILDAHVLAASPTSQMRMARLRGGARIAPGDLRHHGDWQLGSRILAAYRETPVLELDGRPA
ncbi:MAG: beta-N-acetylhexosaminidase [Steroidobacteraceae bacterium]